MLVATTEKVAGYRDARDAGPVFRRGGALARASAGISSRACAPSWAAKSTNTRSFWKKRAARRWTGWSSNATAMGANAVIMMRFDSSEIGQPMSEIVAYGTAVVLEPE